MKTVTVSTHSGFYHADELFAIATLRLFLQKQDLKLKIIRTRDSQEAFKCDYCIDVGRQYDPSKNRYDHHQVDKSLIRENGIPYAAFGLIWRHFGESLVSSKEVFESIEKKIVMPIDGMDNAVSISTKNFEDIQEYNIASTIHAISDFYGAEKLEESFYECLEMCYKILCGEIKRSEEKAQSALEVKKMIEEQAEPDILVLNKYHSWKKVVIDFPNVKFVIFPDTDKSKWYLQPALKTNEDFSDFRVRFPESWLGKENQSLVEVSGIEEAVFCHKSGYLAVLNSKKSALAMANKVLELN